MSLETHLNYGHFDIDGEVLELPYQGDRLSMLIYLPDVRGLKDYQTIAGQFARVAGHGSARLAQRVAALQNVSVHVQLPKFTIENNLHLKTQMEQMGIRLAFQETSADLSRIDGQRDLFVYDMCTDRSLK